MENGKMRALISVQIGDLEKLLNEGNGKFTEQRMDMLRAEINGLRVRMNKYL